MMEVSYKKLWKLLIDKEMKKRRTYWLRLELAGLLLPSFRKMKQSV